MDWLDTCIRVLKFRHNLPLEKRDRLDVLIEEEIGRPDKESVEPRRKEIEDILNTIVESSAPRSVDEAARRGFKGQ